MIDNTQAGAYWIHRNIFGFAKATELLILINYH